MHFLVFANGDPGDLPHPDQLPPADGVLAADGGATNAWRLGLFPTIIIGDLDSLDSAEKQRLETAGARLITYPADKDATDLELALHYAVEQGATQITLVGLLGGRPDQALANIFLLTQPALAGVTLMVLGKGWRAHVVREMARLRGQVGDTVSLIPLTPRAEGVQTAGLAWALHQATLLFGSSLGISNKMTAAEAQVSLREGILFVVHTPGNG